MKAKGTLDFNRMLYSKDIAAFNKVLTAPPNSSKPNGGIYPFSFDKEYTKFEIDSPQVYEIERIVKELINVIEYEQLPELTFTGKIVCIDEDEHEMSYKVFVDKNKIHILKLTEELPEPERHLQCPHCQKVFKARDYSEVAPDREENILPSWSIGTEAY